MMGHRVNRRHHACTSLQWRHNGGNGVSNHQLHHCLLNRSFRRRSKKTSKLRVTGLCAGNSPGTGEFPAQMASNTENVSIWWRHDVDGDFDKFMKCAQMNRLVFIQLIIKTDQVNYVLNMSVIDETTVLIIFVKHCNNIYRDTACYKVWQLSSLGPLINCRFVYVFFSHDYTHDQFPTRCCKISRQLDCLDSIDFISSLLKKALYH